MQVCRVGRAEAGLRHWLEMSLLPPPSSTQASNCPSTIKVPEQEL